MRIVIEKGRPKMEIGEACALAEVSLLMKALLLRHRVAVSARAALYIAKHYQNGTLRHPTKPFVQESDFE